jgi:hypothetical protein
MESNYAQMKSYVERNKFPFTESSEQNCKHIDVQHGKAKCAVKIYSTGTIQLQGAESKLKEALDQAKQAVENEESIGEILPFEIERFPEMLREQIPNVDPIIVRFVEEAIVTVKAGSNLGCAFLLGGASEKATLLLVDAYAKAISDEKMREQFMSRISGKFIARV